MWAPNRLFVFLVTVISLIGIGVLLWRDNNLRLLYADQKPLLVDIAHNQTARTRGLSYRSALANGHGMLFVFDKPEAACMWMKDMKFPLDVYWFSASGKLISYSLGVYPSSFPAVYCPNENASYMLEVNAGELPSLPSRIGLLKQ